MTFHVARSILFVLGIALCASAQTPEATSSTDTFVVPPEKSEPVVIPKFDKPPVIDGKLDEEVWQKALVRKDFYQIQPGDNVPPSRPTELPPQYAHVLHQDVVLDPQELLGQSTDYADSV